MQYGLQLPRAINSPAHLPHLQYPVCSAMAVASWSLMCLIEVSEAMLRHALHAFRAEVYDGAKYGMQGSVAWHGQPGPISFCRSLPRPLRSPWRHCHNCRFIRSLPGGSAFSFLAFEQNTVSACRQAIREAAFETSHCPVIITLENYLSPEGQRPVPFP